jgi:hypothetical protein
MFVSMETEKIPYLYITGASYSGSTLLAFLIDSHPEMTSISEVGGPIPGTDIGTYSCSCGETLLACPFYREVTNRIRSLGSEFELGEWRTLFQFSRHRAVDIPFARPLRNTFLENIRDRIVPIFPAYRRTMREIALRNLHFARAVLQLTGKKVFADAQKDSIRIKFLRDIGRLDLKVIHLIRDARGGTASYMKHNNGRDAAWAARFWAKANLNADRARRFVSSDRWLRIHYNDLCDDYQACMDRISDFVGVERATIPENFFGLEHHIVGNEMRMKRDQRVIRDLSWKKRLADEDLAMIAREAGSASHHFGFDWP